MKVAVIVELEVSHENYVETSKDIQERIMQPLRDLGPCRVFTSRATREYGDVPKEDGVTDNKVDVAG